ncbi:MAG: hypothetical protein DME21_12680 [Verrucomicrobia bacterium]|nr:MAG: hypothetical protein DME21_12680 [Verrucomicrobiota bacterium]
MKTPNCISHRRFRLIAVRLSFVASLCAGLCLLPSSVLGGDETGAKKAPKKAAAVKPEKKAEEKVVITGSLIPQKVKRGRIPATASPVVIIDQKDIERSGATTVAQALRKQGLGR